MLDAILILGKELRRDPARAHRELRARSAAAAAAARAVATDPWIVTLEAPLAGQDQAGSRLVLENLRLLGVPDEQVIRMTQTRSTREEAVWFQRLARRHSWRRLMVITSAYHLARAGLIFHEHFSGAVRVRAPEAFYAVASAQEQDWIQGGVPTEETMRREGQAELLLAGAARVIRWLPASIRWKMEIAAGALLRASTP
ncbi:MAG: ElyC/SanA/YdcF family protein [Myxococcota bacterium]